MVITLASYARGPGIGTTPIFVKPFDLEFLLIIRYKFGVVDLIMPIADIMFWSLSRPALMPH